MEPLNATPPAYQFLKIPPDLIWTRLSIWENFCLSNCTHSTYTVKPLNSGHHWFSEKVSAIGRCPL